MTQTTETPDPRTQMPLAAIDELQRRVLLSLTSPDNRADLRAIRALPTWRSVTWARVAYKCKAISRAELDRITHEAELGGVKADKRPGPVVTDPAVETLCVAVHPGWDSADDAWRAEQRDTLRRALAAAVRRLDWSAVIPDEDELARAIADPGTVARRSQGETVTRWSARAVGQLLRHKLFG